MRITSWGSQFLSAQKHRSVSACFQNLPDAGKADIGGHHHDYPTGRFRIEHATALGHSRAERRDVTTERHVVRLHWLPGNRFGRRYSVAIHEWQFSLANVALEPAIGSAPLTLILIDVIMDGSTWDRTVPCFASSMSLSSSIL